MNWSWLIDHAEVIIIVAFLLLAAAHVIRDCRLKKATNDKEESEQEASKKDKQQADEYYKVYEGHRGILRTWLVAYGIGAPVIVLANVTIWDKLQASPVAIDLAARFLGGVFCQVLLAFINKHVAWGNYSQHDTPNLKGCWWAKLTDKVS